MQIDTHAIPFILLMGTSLFAQPSRASPTEEAFQPCREIAVAALERCLWQQSIGDSEHCWLQSHSERDRCADEIRAHHAGGLRSERAHRASKIERSRGLRATP